MLSYIADINNYKFNTPWNCDWHLKPQRYLSANILAHITIEYLDNLERARSKKSIIHAHTCLGLGTLESKTMSPK